MSTNINESLYEREAIPGGIQRKTTKFLQDTKEVDLAINASFERIGGVQKTLGMSQIGNSLTVTSTSTTSTSTSTSTSSSTSTSTSTSSTTTP